MAMRYLWIALAVLAVFSWRQWSHREIVHEPGSLAPDKPVQTMMPPGPALQHGEFSLRRRAQFGLQARVLSAHRYRWGRDAELSPLDLALGWGPMSDQAVLDSIEITQGNRWYFTRFELPPPIPESAIIGNSGNMHMVPAEPWIEDELEELRRGDVIRLEGYLVDARGPSGFHWNTSLSREDTGDGSCELFLVTGLQRQARP